MPHDLFPDSEPRLWPREYHQRAASRVSPNLNQHIYLARRHGALLVFDADTESKVVHGVLKVGPAAAAAAALPEWCRDCRVSLQLRSESVAENRRARARWEGRQRNRERRAGMRAGLA